ncbi:PH domain-containing protein [Nocardioides panacihumi]|uniref:PH domain-containing protein n=1 Tax=Nocardioides panacihumi TaxID=400774 RepID=A0ABN2RLQ0_9ACTN
MTDEWQRLDPRTLATQPVATAAKALIPALAWLVGAGSAVGFNIIVPITVAGVLLIGALPWLTTSFRVTATHLEIRRGLLNRTTVTARLDRVRSVDLESDVVHRFLGVTKVAVGTGVDEGRLELDSLGAEDAERLRVALLHGSRATDEPTAGTPPEEVVRLDWSWVRFAPLNVGNLAIAVAAFGALVSQFDNLIDERRVERVWHWLGRSDLPLLVAGALVAAIVLWVPLACLGYAVRWFGLSVTREQGKEGPTLRRVHGALTHRATTVEEAKVRGAVVRRRALVGLAGGAELHVLTTGLDDNETHLLPSAPLDVVLDVATDVLGERAPVAAAVTAHGPSARRRFLIRNLRDAALAAAGAALVVGAGDSWGLALPWWLPVVVLVVAVPVAVATAQLHYKRLGHTLTDRYLVSCTGTFTAARTVLETDGIVGWRVHQSWWDRRRGLAQLVATTAAGHEQVLVPDVPVGEAVAVATAATPRMLAEFLA